MDRQPLPLSPTPDLLEEQPLTLLQGNGGKLRLVVEPLSQSR